MTTNVTFTAETVDKFATAFAKKRAKRNTHTTPGVYAFVVDGVACRIQSLATTVNTMQSFSESGPSEQIAQMLFIGEMFIGTIRDENVFIAGSDEQKYQFFIKQMLSPLVEKITPYTSQDVCEKITAIIASRNMYGYMRGEFNTREFLAGDETIVVDFPNNVRLETSANKLTIQANGEEVFVMKNKFPIYGSLDHDLLPVLGGFIATYCGAATIPARTVDVSRKSMMYMGTLMLVSSEPGTPPRTYFENDRSPLSCWQPGGYSQIGNIRSPHVHSRGFQAYVEGGQHPDSMPFGYNNVQPKF